MTKEQLISTLEELLSESPESVSERERTTFDRQAAPFENQLILFGTGKLGRRTLKGLREIGIEPLAFCDNNPKIWGERIEGLKVLSPSEAVRDLGNKAAFVVTIWNDALGHPLDEVREKLQSLGEVTVLSFLPLYWKYPKQFLPYFSLDLASKILGNREDILKLSLLISDKDSRTNFFENIKSRFLSELQILPQPIAKEIQFKNEFIKTNTEEVFIDGGAYNGDTVKLLLNSSPFAFKEIIALEPDPINFSSLNRYVKELDPEVGRKIRTIPVAIGNKNGEITFDGTGTEQAQISSSGAIAVQCARIDDLFKGKEVTYIKMDIEGAEPEALDGAVAIISQHSPVLAISIYHQINHLWKLALMIYKMNKNYSFFFRPHASGGWDYILYAVPQSRLATTTEE